MVMAVNNAALLGGQAVVDTSGWADQFRDGQKLRQEYESRQQTKALNELMGIEDFNERIAKARTHKYAGALIPALQKSEQDRLIAEQTYNQGQADINKTNAEVGRINSESGEIGAKTTGQTIKNLAEKYSGISAGALTQDKQLFAMMLGDYQNAGLINPEHKGRIIDMMVTDPDGAVAVMQRIARGNLDIFKATAPKSEVLDGKDAAYLYTTNGFTGEANAPTAKINYGVSKTDQMKDATSRANNQYTVDAGERNNIRSTDASIYSTNVGSEDKRYVANVASEDRRLQLDQNGRLGWARVSQAQQKLDNPKANRGQIPPSAMKTMGELKQNLVSNAQTMKENDKWLGKLRSGDLQLSAGKNFGNTFAARTGITAAGSNPKDFAEFNAYIKDLANKALRLNAGVQTDADYKRQLEAIVSGGNLPRDNNIAVTLLGRIHRDFDSQNRGIYQNLAAYRKEYEGVNIPTYGSNEKKTNTGTSGGGNSKGASIIEGVFRSK